MKKIVILILAMLSQTASAGMLITADFGLSRAHLFPVSGKYWESSSPIASASVALGSDYIFDNGFMVGTSFKYEEMGFELMLIEEYIDHSGTIHRITSNEVYTFSYLSIPLSAGYVFGEPFPGHLRGGVVGSRISKVRGRDLDSDFPGYYRRADITDQFAEFDFSGFFEIAYRHAGDRAFTIVPGARYQVSLADQPFQKPMDDKSFRHQVFSIFVSLKFDPGYCSLPRTSKPCP